MRMVAEDRGEVQEAPQASPSCRISLSSNSTAASSQRRVARIQEHPVVSSSPSVFDMRGGCSDRLDEVRVINCYIGEEDESFEEGKERAVTEELDTEELEEQTPMTTIILDSGADAPVFRGDWLHHGARVQPEFNVKMENVRKMSRAASFRPFANTDIYFIDVGGRRFVCVRGSPSLIGFHSPSCAWGSRWKMDGALTPRTRF